MDKTIQKLQNALHKMRNLKDEVIRLQKEFKARFVREHNLTANIAMFTNSFKNNR